MTLATPRGGNSKSAKGEQDGNSLDWSHFFFFIALVAIAYYPADISGGFRVVLGCVLFYLCARFFSN